MSDEKVSLLVDHFANISPSKPQIFEHVEADCDVTPNTARLLISALGGIVDISASQGGPNIVADQISRDDNLSLEEPERVRLSRHLTTLLQSSAVARVAKAVVLQVEHPNIYREARMFSDLRPVLDADASTTPSAVVLSHTLKVEYIDSSERINKLFVVLDAEDLRALHAVISRELNKSDNLNRFAESMNLARFDFWGGA